jgi:glutamine synthetase
VADLSGKLMHLADSIQTTLDNPPHGTEAHMRHCADTLVPLMAQLREAVDGLECLVDDTIWPLPSYQEMLFIR